MKFQMILAVLGLALLTGCPPAQHSSNSDNGRFSEKPKVMQRPLNPYGYLRKLSLHLRGRAPSSKEYAILRQAIEQKATQFHLSQKRAEYLNSLEHTIKMEDRLSELFQILPTQSLWKESAKYNPNQFSNEFGLRPFNALNILFREMSTKNLPWDHLLKAKSFSLYKEMAVGLNGISDPAFFSVIARDQIKDYPDPVDGHSPPQVIRFHDDDKRVAGALTTGRFFTRYVTTTINKNRKRAAAIFRIFLCDDMKATLPPTEGQEELIYDLIFPETTPEKSKSTPILADEDAHGADPACMNCHYKLDPMGKNFELSSYLLSPRPAWGRLTYKKENGELVDVATLGLGGLAEQIVQQEEYLSCQVRHFWNWFIGEDTPLTKAREAQLVKDFVRLERRTNDFIYHLTSQDEFWRSGEVSEVNDLERDSLRILSNCTGCHKNEDLPDFTLWPIGGQWDAHNDWLARIEKSLALTPGQSPAERNMPPKSSRWQPTVQDLDVLRKWFAEMEKK